MCWGGSVGTVNSKTRYLDDGRNLACSPFIYFIYTQVSTTRRRADSGRARD